LNPNFRQNTTNVITAFGEKDHRYPAKEFLRILKDDARLQKALIKVVPVVQKQLDTIESMIDEIPTSFKTKGNEEITVCSDIRKHIYKRQLHIRFEDILLPAYEDVLGNAKTIKHSKVF